MKNNKKNKRKYVLLLLLFLLVSITVGYALLSATLNINGKSGIGKSTWDVHFENVQVTSGSVTPTTAATIDADDPLTVTYDAPLTLPGEFYEFTVDVVNKGTVDAKLTEIVKTTLTADQDKYANYTVTYADGSPIAENDTLANTTGKATIKVRIEFDSTVTELPAEAVAYDELKLTLTYEQAA